ncbi:MAG: hypothetical protein HRT44_02945, partial [Bdellovibrionales bacterium]|nr:hypothetical protein [Bdellovibrionales bacterium]NQZ18203.1 hypothetical protein [Bdellovibrionales bacterium]
MKVFFLILLSLSLTNCEFTISGEGEFEELEIPIGEDPELYSGEVDSIRYYRGGWFSAPNQPNFAADLELQVLRHGEVEFSLETPTCQAEGIFNVRDYEKLANMILDAETTAVKRGPVDVGDHILEVSVEGEDYVYHFGAAERLIGKEDLQLSRRDSRVINRLIDQYVEELEDKHCGYIGINSRMLAL